MKQTKKKKLSIDSFQLDEGIWIALLLQQANVINIFAATKENNLSLWCNMQHP